MIILTLKKKGIFSRNTHMPNKHSLCIINLDDYQSQGTRWVACAPSHEKETFYGILILLACNILRNMSSEPNRMV